MILADSCIALKEIIEHLKEYCELNRLEINIETTKVVLFQKGGYRKKSAPVPYGNDKIEFANIYNYLGITFKQSAIFADAAKDFVNKATLAAFSTLSLIQSMNPSSWSIYENLFNSLVTSCLFYGAPIWSLNYLDSIERVQNTFFKKLLNLPKSIPSYAIRVETGKSLLAALVFN